MKLQMSSKKRTFIGKIDARDWSPAGEESGEEKG